MRSVRNWFTRLLAILGGHELGVLLALAGLAAGVWIFVVIAGEVAEGDTASMDRRLLLAFRHPADLSAIGPPAVQDAARYITALGGPSVLTPVTLITAGI